MAKHKGTTIKSLADLAAVRVNQLPTVPVAEFDLKAYNDAVDAIIDEILVEAGLDKATLDELKKDA